MYSKKGEEFHYLMSSCGDAVIFRIVASLAPPTLIAVSLKALQSALPSNTVTVHQYYLHNTVVMTIQKVSLMPILHCQCSNWSWPCSSFVAFRVVYLVSLPSFATIPSYVYFQFSSATLKLSVMIYYIRQ